METLRQKRSTVCTANRSSGLGNLKTHKLRKSATLASDSGSFSSGVTDKDSLMLDLGQRSSRRPAGTPIKHLLAKEMSQESESRRRSQSVIARLMGLEGPPPPQPAQKPQRRCSQEHRLTAKVEKVERSSPFSSRRSSRRSSQEEQEFKDVFEVVEAPKVEKSTYRSPGTARSNITSEEMAFIRQKFVEAKRLSTDDKLQDSKEFHDAIEVLDSNRDLLLKFLQQPDSLFTKHMNDLEVAPFQSHFSHISTAKSSKAHACEPNYHGLKSGREKLPRKSRKSSDKHKNNLPGHQNCGSPDTLKPAKLEGRKDSDIVPTRIVVLKPNLGKVYHSTKSPSSPPSHSLLSDSSSLEDFPSFRSKDMEQIRRKKLNGDVDLKLQLEGSRAIAKEISMKMKDEYDSGSPSILPLKISEYGDDSSSTVSMNDSANESDITILTSTKSSDWNNRCKHASCSTESSVTREAKRRLSRRWKMTHKSEDMGELSRGSTLADMLATDRDARSPDADCHNGRKAFASNDLSGALVEPLGISSRDGWKDVCVNNLSRSRSVPSSSNFSGSPRANMSCEAPRNCRYTIPRETIKWEKNKKIIGHADSRDALAPRKLRSRQSERHPRRFIRGETSSASEEFHPRQNQPKPGLMEMGALWLSPVFSESSASIVHDDLAVEHVNKFSPAEALCPQLSTPFLNSSCSDRDDQEPLDGSSKEIPDTLHRPVPELQSPASSKEADQPSPVSTLEAPFTDDPSSGSECFESLSADLHGLRMQLQLLKLESEAYGEGNALISSDEDVGEGPFGTSEDRAAHKTKGSWESSYVTDILVRSGYVDYDPDTFVSKLHSLKSPVDPSMFEELEKSHSSESSSRPERRLLFDRLNSGLNEIYQQLTDPHPWAMAMRPALGFKLSRDGLLDGLCRSLVGRDKKANKGTLDRVLISESQWLNLGDDYDIIGKEIERLLVDDILAEVVVELI
ncbi:uncharacterized protein LOC116209548 isoform X2 [Punica granatum]|uniref:Uncharacterized protein LOC116209548 isoform X2 n=1 Tax=Punica granatum TaxID=22663 RepID=A0A6P8DT35_PUNGR|nr:uncharacterized protein LOC116209548 isoform X2 [Punica granatum]